MTTITILPETTSNGSGPYQALAGTLRSSGRTLGEALDALTAQLGEVPNTALVVVQHFQPDRFFTADLQQRLAELMAQWRAARAAGQTLPAEEQAELDALVTAETRASAERAAAPLRGLQP